VRREICTPFDGVHVKLKDEVRNTASAAEVDIRSSCLTAENCYAELEKSPFDGVSRDRKFG
jgi:hypothetical protein